MEYTIQEGSIICFCVASLCIRGYRILEGRGRGGGGGRLLSTKTRPIPAHVRDIISLFMKFWGPEKGAPPPPWIRP